MIGGIVVKHGSDSPNLSCPGNRGAGLIQCYLYHASVPVEWHLIPSNVFSRVNVCDKRPDGQTD